VDVDSAWDVGKRDDVDVVGWVVAAWLDGWSLDEAWEALSVTLDGLVDPVTDRDSWTGVWEASVDITASRRWWSGGGQGSSEEHGSDGVLHDELG